MKGRPPIPSALQEQKGAWQHNPDRKRTDATPRAPLKAEDAPSNLTVTEVEMWNEIIDNAPLHVLKNCDKFVVEMTARTLAKIRYATDLKLSMTQEIGLLGTARQLLSLMGMTPADRSRVLSEPDAVSEDDALDEFITH